MKQRYKAIVSYNGQNYHGWARQPNNITIQQIIENSFQKLFNKKILIFSAGRTDARVSAKCQVIHFDIENIKISNSNLLNSINKLLPYDIKFLKIQKVKNIFNARFDAKSKIYKYQINVSKTIDPIQSSFIYQYNKEINVCKIKSCLKLFIGKHNFLSFSTADKQKEDTIRTIYSFNVKKQKSLVVFLIKGNGFLRSMVRMIIGTIIAFNEDRIDIKTIKSLFANPKKGASLFKAPACGLTLEKIIY